jgi:hypothetical protein
MSHINRLRDELDGFLAVPTVLTARYTFNPVGPRETNND